MHADLSEWDTAPIVCNGSQLYPQALSMDGSRLPDTYIIFLYPTPPSAVHNIL